METERNGGGSSCRAARVMNPGRALSSTEQQFAGEVLQLTLPKWAEQMTRQLPIVSFSFRFILVLKIKKKSSSVNFSSFQISKI